MPEAFVREVRAIHGVRVAAPLLEASAQATGPRASESVSLVGADASLKQLGGGLVRHTELAPFAGIGAVLLPQELSKRIGVRKFGSEVALRAYGRVERAPLYEVLHEVQVGGLAASPIVVTKSPPSREELSSPNLPLAKLTKSILLSSMIFLT